VDIRLVDNSLVDVEGRQSGSDVLQKRKLRGRSVRHYAKCTLDRLSFTRYHGFFLSSSRISLPIQASLDKARSWIRELQRQADPSIIIALCGNKIDLSSRRQVTAEEAKKYAEEEGLMWCEASAKTGEGVQDVFMAIAKKLPLNAPQSQKGAAAAAAARAGGSGRGGGGVDLSKQTAAPDGCNC